MNSSETEMIWKDSPSVEQLMEKIENLHLFLQPLLPLVNSHSVQFLVEDQWNNVIPQPLREDLLTLTRRDLRFLPSAEIPQYPNVFLDSANDSLEFSHFQRFLLTVRSFHLDRLGVLTRVPKLVNESLNMDKVISLSMNKKKAHEVGKLSNFIGNICKGNNLDWMVDVGSGLGYLSSVLLLEYKYNVLALDCSCYNIASSLERCRRMQTRLEQYDKKSCKKEIDIKETVLSDDLSELELDISDDSEDIVRTFTSLNKRHLLGVTKFIETDENLQDIVLSHFKSDENFSKVNDVGDLGIVGLHTCGNLSPTSLKLYNANSNAKFLCNIGCCYHLLDEEFCTDSFYINKMRTFNIDNRYDCEEVNPFLRRNLSETGFPLSSYLKSVKFSLGRNARNLASRPASNKLSVDDENLKTMFWRALFEVIVIDVHGSWPEGAYVGRGIGKKWGTFYLYCQECFKNIGLDIKVSEDQINSYYEKYKHMEDLFTRYSLLKGCLAPLIENLISMDRLLYLKENGYSNSHLVQIFGPTLSPRCTAVVSFKD